MSDDKSDEIPMAECGSCRAVIPLNSEECPECGISFSGVSDESLGECGACKALVPLDSKSCPKCGVYFVADDVVDVLRKWFVETGVEVGALFSKMDADNDGSIDAEELKDGLLKLNLADLPPSQVDRLVQEFDSDNDGKISLEELVFTITGEEIESIESEESTQKEYSENVLVRVMEKYSISDRDAFLLHSQDYDSNDNGYLTEGEFKAAAEAYSESSEEESSEQESEEPVTEEPTEDVIEDSNEVKDEDVEEESTEEDSTEKAEVESEDESVEEAVEDPEEVTEQSPMHRLGVAASQGGMTIREVFEAMDLDDDGLIDGPELQKGIEQLSGDKLSPTEVFEILKSLDEDSDGRVNPMELVNALESLDLDIKSDKSGGMRDPVSILIEAMDDAGTNPGRVFRQLDKNGDGNININELRSEVESFIEESLSDEEMDHLFERLDDDGDGFIDMYEFIENLEEYEDSEDEETSLSSKVEFPSKMQSRMMSKKWNDVFWPLIHAGLFIFIVMWIVNGSLAPFVSGEGGNIELVTETGLYDDGEKLYFEGDIYPCVDSVQTDGCKNSLTPLAGESSSMPAGFYWDGILFIILGSLGLVSSLFTHLSIVPGWRARAKAIRDSEKERKEVDEESEDSDDDSQDEEETDDEELDSDDADDESEVEEITDDEEVEDDEIDIGSHIGLVLDDEEIFGVIVEFDDDENLVTIEEDGTGDLVTGYQDDMFLED
ncbi:MAG: EF-hand domain-containing protein [Candidatus Poseidoniaceae archaeon]|nr:EF-hand domain-containing protein [Candidatus Poseidoniaceae archaeon]